MRLPYQVNPFSDTHCVCSFEKNYRLQDIQLSKNLTNPKVGLPAEARLRDGLRRAKVGGEYRARTGDLLVANQALSQLS